MPSKLPEIRIINAWLLRNNASVHLHKLWGEGSKLASHEDVDKIVSAYKEAWKKHEKIVLNAMVDILGVNFRKNIIDVYIAPWFSAFSEPLIIGVVHNPDEFVDILTHELLHDLLTDNSKISIYDEKNTLGEKWSKSFGEDLSFNVVVHIPVHAVHKKIYLEYMNDKKRLDRDIKNSDKFHDVDYKKAWEYVDEHGADEIIKKTKEAMEV